MKVTATGPSRSFSTVLDIGKRADTNMVTSGEMRIAVTGPATTASGRAVKAFLVRTAGMPDADYEGDIAATRQTVDDEMRTA
ncbi:hypothetical protein [Nonomuraea sp. NPDC048901]|uniref:hypothetical protein n=1 Tax=Nonomuraea sp. NPDC048901 TaxID=3155627 RepID=UPI0033CE8D48